MYSSPVAQSTKDLNLPHTKQMESGILRFQSAQSSVMGEVCEDLLPVHSLSPETDTDGMFARFLESNLQDDIRDKSSEVAANRQRRPRFPSQLVEVDGGRFSSSALQIMDSNANLVRHSSSPAGLFVHSNTDNGYDMMRGAGGFRNGSISTGHQGNRLKGQLSYSSRQNSIMSQISEVGTEGINGSSPDESTGQYCIPGIFAAPWDDSSSLMSENNSSSMKRGREDERKIVAGLNSSETQIAGMRSQVSLVNHQFSLPKTLSEMQAIEKFLQFQDTVPCKIRAKRGCATHPRSIAERVRRTRISERMKKLQELVPNMDKQTNTSDMLDIAVDYIKDLEKQVKMLAESRKSCSCSSTRLKSFSNQ